MTSRIGPGKHNPEHLSVGTQRDNILDSIRKGRYNVFGHQKLDAAKVRQIRALAARGLRHKDIAARFGIARHHVGSIVNRTTWAHLDPPFVESGGEPEVRVSYALVFANVSRAKRN